MGKASLTFNIFREVRPSEHWYTVIKTMFGTPAQFRMGHQLARQDEYVTHQNLSSQEVTILNFSSDNIVAKRSRNNKFRPAYGFGKRKRSMLPVFPEDDLNNDYDEYNVDYQIGFYTKILTGYEE